MAEPDLKRARARLNTERGETARRVAELEQEFAAIVASARDGSSGSDDEHDPEGATVAFERQHVAALIERFRAHLAEVEAALAKIDSGTYGICDMCGAAIGAPRLAARPAASTCIRCAARRR